MIIDLDRPATLVIRPTEERGLAISPAAREALKIKTRLSEEKFVALVNAIHLIGILWFIERRQNVDNQAHTDRINKALRLFQRGVSELSGLPDAKAWAVSERIGVDLYRLSRITEAHLMRSLKETHTHIRRRAGGKSAADDNTVRASERVLKAWEVVTGQPADQRQYNGSMLDVCWTLLSEMRFKEQQIRKTPVDGNPRRVRYETYTWDCSEFRDACKNDLLKAVVRREDRIRKTPRK